MQDVLSDVIEVIETDPDFRDPTVSQSTMYNGGGEVPAQPNSSAPPPSHIRAGPRKPYVKIIEQPAPKALRFRYECEGRSAGSIPGARSSSENKTYPTIQIVGYQGKAVVVVSCVTKDRPYKPHPHNLVGREGCKKGIFKMNVTSSMVSFTNLGVQCVKRKSVKGSLEIREKIQIDPFQTGFDHKNQPTSIDLNTVRLCFQVFLESKPQKFSEALTPVVSDPIFDKKAMSDLSITKLSDCTSYVGGGKKDIILLCEKVAKEDIQVRFFEKDSDWEAFADIQPAQVHKQHAIFFKTPKYKRLDVTEPVQVMIQLRRPSDGAASVPLPFELLPLDSESGMLKRKRTKREDPSYILKQLQESCSKDAYVPGDAVKLEPAELMASPMSYRGGVGSPYGSSVSSYGSPYQNAASPGYIPNIMSPPYNTPVVTPSVDNRSYPANFLNINLPSTSQQPPICMPQTTNFSSNSTNTGGTTFWNFNTNNITSDEINNALDNINPQEVLEVMDNLNLSDMDISLNSNPLLRSDSLTRLANNTIDGMYK